MVITFLLKNWTRGKCGSRILIGLAAMVYEPLYRTRQTWVVHASARKQTIAKLARLGNISWLLLKSN